ncbi:energy transducer TonB [Rubrivivax benzoatilyticus]|uniref:TonB family protein n=1 Tax=Rubrivivax benzoatilyticus TaxID=316997 RepID=A0ABX0HVW7_9BURK|nr:energy transducer TonB [Rubrivivax benzoatilyticus]EGJ09007.1 periplasmic protein/ biopolymer transport [Rubrivivax benzoatilyticus JA2 = ATCC BAA-35]NHK97693.1 TonB family protein [Rubrivivax benzoatilyticus]NHL23195.1 TonB family protein [Rubrivivax benzoatilyticus]
MNTMTLAPQLPPSRRRPAFSLVVIAAHLGLFWLALEFGVLERAVASAAPLVVQIVAPVAPREPQPEPLIPRPANTPPPLATVPVPEVAIQREAPAETIRVAAAPAEPVAPPPAAAPAPAPVTPSIRQVPASALRYLAEPPVAVPLASRRLRESGTVVLRVVVDVHGHPRSVTLRRSSGFPRLDEQALGAMRQARFVPCTDNGRPVECESDAPIVYELQG